MSLPSRVSTRTRPAPSTPPMLSSPSHASVRKNKHNHTNKPIPQPRSQNTYGCRANSASSASANDGCGDVTLARAGGRRVGTVQVHQHRD